MIKITNFSINWTNTNPLRPRWRKSSLWWWRNMNSAVVIVALFGIWYTYDSDARSKIKFLLTESSSTITESPIETMTDEIGAVVPKKLEFGYRDISEVKVPFEKSGLSGFWHMNKREIDSIKSFTKSGNFWIQIITEGFKPLLAGKNWVWKSRRLNNDSTFRKLRINRTTTQGKKPPEVQCSAILKLRRLWLGAFWKNWAMFFWRRRSCCKNENQNWLRFRVLPQSGPHRTTISCKNFSL